MATEHGLELIEKLSYENTKLRMCLGAVRANLIRLAWEENSVMIEGIDKALQSPNEGEAK